MLTTDDFARGVDALVTHADPVAAGRMRIAFPLPLFDRNVPDSKAMIASVLTLLVGNNQGMDNIAHAKLLDFYAPTAFLELFDGPAANIDTLLAVLGRKKRTDPRHHHQAQARPAPQPFARPPRLLAGMRLHQERRAAGQSGVRPMKETMRAVPEADGTGPGRNRRGEAVLRQRHRRRSSEIPARRLPG